MPESKPSFWEVLLPDWVRRGKQADLTNISVGKLQDAAKRGIQIDEVNVENGRVTARVNKIVIKK